MKKNGQFSDFKLLLLLSLFLFGAARGAAADNLIRNPGFENGLKHWSTSEWSGKPYKCRMEADTSNKSYDGKACAVIEWQEGGDNFLLGQKISLRQARNFLFSFHAKANVRVSDNAPGSATVSFLGKNGKRCADNIHYQFTMSDTWQKFNWSFTAPADAHAMIVYLRCRRICTYFDNVELFESNGVCVKNVIPDMASQELVLDVYNDGDSAVDAIQVEVADAQGKMVTKRKLALRKAASAPVCVPVPGIQAGEHTLKLYPEGHPEKAEIKKFSYPAAVQAWPAPYEKLKVRNNFVTELLMTSGVRLEAGKSLEFVNPRNGWVRFVLTAKEDAQLKLDDEALPIPVKKGQAVESMRYLKEGRHVLFSTNALELTSAEILTMGESIACEYEVEGDRRTFTNGLMDSAAMQEFLNVAPVIMERYEKHDVLDLDSVPESARARHGVWRREGKRIVTTVPRTGFSSRWKVRPKDSERFWSTRVGMRELDGISLDEFGPELPGETEPWAPAVRSLTKKFPGKTIYAYSNASWYAFPMTADLRKALREGNHVLVPELYMREQANEAEAKVYINGFFDWMRNWEIREPGSMPHLMWTYGSCDSYYAFYVLDTFASADYRVFLDYQFAVLANDPAFFGMRGVAPWILRYTRPDTLAWEAKLIRHYLLEGKRTLLSAEYDLAYSPGYLVNADCEDGLTGWSVSPAGNGSITAENIKDYGFDRGTRNSAPRGDRVIRMSRVPGKVNRVTQTIRNLRPGRTYEVTVLSADFDAVMDRERKPELKLMPLRMMVKGAEVIPGKSVIHVYPVVQKMNARKYGICGNHCSLVFRATAPEAQLEITDEAPEIPARTFHGQPFAPADMRQKNVIFNFVQVTELLEGAAK